MPTGCSLLATFEAALHPALHTCGESSNLQALHCAQASGAVADALSSAEGQTALQLALAAVVPEVLSTQLREITAAPAAGGQANGSSDIAVTASFDVATTHAGGTLSPKVRCGSSTRALPCCP